MMKNLCIVLAFITSLMGFRTDYDRNAYEQWEKYSDEKALCEQIMESFITKDPSYIEDLVAPKTKSSRPDLTESITGIVNALDGDIEKWFIQRTEDTSDYDGYGGVLYIRSININVKTTKYRYMLLFQFVAIDTVYPDEVGLRVIGMEDPCIFGYNKDDDPEIYKMYYYTPWIGCPDYPEYKVKPEDRLTDKELVKVYLKFILEYIGFENLPKLLSLSVK